MAQEDLRNVAMADSKRAIDTDDLAALAEGLGTSRYKEYDIAQYVEMVQASIPQDLWSGVFYSWLSLKGHLQGLMGLQRTEMFAAVQEDDSVYACFLTIWDDADVMAAWLRDGNPVHRMIIDLGVPEGGVVAQLLRDYS